MAAIPVCTLVMTTHSGFSSTVQVIAPNIEAATLLSMPTMRLTRNTTQYKNCPMPIATTVSERPGMLLHNDSSIILNVVWLRSVPPNATASDLAAREAVQQCCRQHFPKGRKQRFCDCTRVVSAGVLVTTMLMRQERSNQFHLTTKRRHRHHVK